jgi:hypothetical protein
MKIAICISGQPRNYEDGFGELKKWFLDKYDCDVYIHTWKDTTTEFTSSHNFTKTRHYKFTEEDYQNILDLYNPVSYKFQRPINFDDTNITGNLGFTINGILSAWLSTQQSIQQALNSKTQYDLIVKYRFDLQFTDYVSPECEILNNFENLNPDYLHCFSFGTHDDGNFRPTEIDDLINIGGPKVMEVYSQLFSHIIKYCYLDPNHVQWLIDKVGDGDVYAHETLLRWHLEQNNIYINRIHSFGEHFTAGIIR